jgi:hypothetical protein
MKLIVNIFFTVMLLNWSVLARDATCLIHNTAEDPEYFEGVYLTGTGGTRQVLKEDVVFACISPDGRKIAYIPMSTKNFPLWIITEQIKKLSLSKQTLISIIGFTGHPMEFSGLINQMLFTGTIPKLKYTRNF